MNTRLYIFFIVFIFIFPLLNQGQAQILPPQLIWEKTYGGEGNEIISSITPTAQGGFLLSGYSDSGSSGDKSEENLGWSTDFWIIHIDAFGNKRWDKTIGTVSGDRLHATLPTADGGYLLGGLAFISLQVVTDLPRRDNYWIVKIDSLGNQLWDKTFGGMGHDKLLSMTTTADGGYLLAGESVSGMTGDKSEASRGRNDIWLIKIDSLGNKLWDKTLGGAENDYCSQVISTEDGGFLVAAYSNSGAGQDKTQPGKGEIDYWLIKIDAEGNKLWDKVYGGSASELLRTLTPTADGGYVLAGQSNSDAGGDKSEAGKGEFDYWILKIDAQGNKLWDKTFGGNANEELETIVPTADNGFLLGGHSRSDISGDKREPGKGNYDFWLVKIDEQGNKLWDKTMGGNERDLIYALEPISDQGYLVAGVSESEISGDKTDANWGSFDYWILRLGRDNANPNSITGQVFVDEQENCAKDDDEAPLQGWYIDARSDTYQTTAITDENGQYTLYLGTGEYTLSQRPSDPTLAQLDAYAPACETQKNLSLNAFGQQLEGVDWALADAPNQISGYIYRDDQNDCASNAKENPFVGWLVEAKSNDNTFYTLTDSSGYFSFQLDTNAYTLSYIPPGAIDNDLVRNRTICPAEGSYFIKFATFSNDSTGFDFVIDRVPCAVLTVDITSSRRLRCFRGQMTITYGNVGITAAENSRIEVQIPEFTIPISSSVPWTSFDENSRLMTFELGTLDAGIQGQIVLTDSISCVNEAFNQSQCTEARIFPRNTCLPPPPEWDQADLVVKARCVLLFDPISVFTILNQGSGAMNQASEYRIYADETLLYEGNVQLQAGDSLSLAVPNQGKSMRLEVDQVPFHPENTQVSTHLEGCGKAGTNTSKGLANRFAQNDENFDVEVSCMQIMGSYDPNDKLVSPEGITEQHYVSPGTQMEYTIRFQNTGTAEAIFIRVVDTLATDWEVSSFQMMSASHDYTLDLRTTEEGQTVLSWFFPEIYLPDSTSNEPESHGYIKFKIRPKAELPIGTEVTNFADIFFDFNDPIRTNTTLTTFEDYVFPEPVTPIDPCSLVSVAKVNTASSYTLCPYDPLPQLIAENPMGGKGEWRVIQGNATLSAPNSSQTSLSNLAQGETIIRWQVSPDLCPDNYQDIRITLNARPEAPVISNPSDSTLLSSISGEGYNWYLNGELIDGANQQSLKARGEGEYRVEVILTGCFSPLSQVFMVDGCTFLSPAAVGGNLNLCESSAQLSASLPEIGQGSWMLVQGSGQIEDPTDPQSSVSELGIGENIFRWRVNPATCPDNYQELRITVKETPAQPIIENPDLDVLQSSIVGDSYRWYFEGALMVTQTTRSFNATESGSYQVEVLKNGCVSTLSDAFVLEVTSLEAELREIYGFRITPNPTEGDVHIRLQRKPKGTLVFNLRGADGSLLDVLEVKGAIQQAWEGTFALEGLPKGIYLLEVYTEKGSFTNKIIRE